MQESDPHDSMSEASLLCMLFIGMISEKVHTKQAGAFTPDLPVNPRASSNFPCCRTGTAN